VFWFQERLNSSCQSQWPNSDKWGFGVLYIWSLITKTTESRRMWFAS